MQRAVLILLLLALAAIGLWTWSRSGTLTPVSPGPAASGTHSEAGEPLAAPGEESSGAIVSATPSNASRTELVPGPPEEAPLRGRLIDKGTEEPVPAYELGVSMLGERTCRVESDAEGRFETPIAYPAGTLLLSLDDVEGQESANSSADLFTRLEHDPAAPEQDVPIGVGPTYFIEMALPAGLEASELRALLYADPPEHRDTDRNFFGMRHPHWNTVLRPAQDGSSLWWVRFRIIRHGPWRVWLSIDSLDGMWRGGARVDGSAGIHPEVARVELRPRCAVRGRYLSATQLDRGGAQIALFRDVEGTRPLLWEHASTEGSFRIADLDPGAYRLEVRDEAFRAAPVRFSLFEGELDLGDLGWEPIPLAGAVRLRVTSAVEVPIDVQLVRTFDPPRYPLWHSDDWEELPDGSFESVFEWEQVHAGEYAVEVHGHGDSLRLSWHRPLGRLEPPVDDLFLELPAPAEPLRFDVRTQGGDEPESWELWLRGEETWERVKTNRIAPFAYDEGFRWAVWSPGHRARMGGLGAASWPGSGERTVRVVLQPGWSRLFFARNRAGWDAVGGAEVWLDGALAGTTDARGELLVERAAPPSGWEVYHPTLVWTEVGSSTSAGGELVHFVVNTGLRPQ